MGKVHLFGAGYYRSPYLEALFEHTTTAFPDEPDFNRPDLFFTRPND